MNTPLIASASAWRRLPSMATDGADAMALDEALLELCTDDPSPFVPTLRFYRFSAPCLSLGRFQSSSDVDVGACQRQGVAIVRRPSGGRAVLHDRCLTYAIVAPVDAAPFSGGVRASAHRIGEALAAGVRLLGLEPELAVPPPRGQRPADCFAVPGSGEVTVQGRKLIGSAQVRRGGAALQHGTLRLLDGAGDIAPLLRVALDRSDTAASVERACARPVSFAEASDALTAGIAASFGVAVVGADLPSAVCDRAAQLSSERYRNDAWTLGR